MTKEELISHYCDYRGKCTTDDVAALTFAYRMLAPRWISVEDELPEEDMPCLIYDERDGVQYASYRCFGKDFKDQSEWGWHINVTHWQYLPAPPKKGAHKGNCRFCAERRKQELKELVEQLKGK